MLGEICAKDFDKDKSGKFLNADEDLHLLALNK
jgi:hypothetical protein